MKVDMLKEEMYKNAFGGAMNFEKNKKNKMPKFQDEIEKGRKYNKRRKGGNAKIYA